MHNTYALEINARTVTYRDDSGEWMDGDSHEISGNETVVIMDDDDYLAFADGHSKAHVMWAIHVIDTTTDAVHPSSSPIGDGVPEHAWLSGSYEDPYEDKTTETSVRLTGDWTDKDRAIVFKAITGKYHTA